MNRLAALVTAAVLLLPAAPAFADREPLVSNLAELNQAIGAAAPGDTIVMADGTWQDTVINLTAAGPLTLRAQTPGKVLLTGKSALSLNSPNLTVSGLTFTGGQAPDGANSVITFNSDYGRITDTAVVDFNPAEPLTRYYWVYFKGGHNRLDHSLLDGKNNHQPVIGNDGGARAKYNTVDRNRLANVANRGLNGMEGLRIWGYGQNGETGVEDGAFFTIEHNVFEHVDGDDEVISLKSNHNVVRFNTIKESHGALVNRMGNYNTIEYNAIIGNGYPGSNGLRVTGDHHLVRGNYVSGVANYGLLVTSGEHVLNENHEPDYLTPEFEPMPRAGAPYGYAAHYTQVTDSVFTGNVFVDNGQFDLHVGFFYKNHWPGYQMVLLPERNTFTGNLIYKPKGGVAVTTSPQETGPPLDKFTFQPNTFQANVVYGGTVDVHAPNSSKGIIVLPNSRQSPPPPPRTAESGPAWSR